MPRSAMGEHRAARGDLHPVGDWIRFADREPADRQRVVYRLRRSRRELIGRWSAERGCVLYGEKAIGRDCVIEPRDSLRDWKPLFEVHG